MRKHATGIRPPDGGIILFLSLSRSGILEKNRTAKFHDWCFLVRIGKISFRLSARSKTLAFRLRIVVADGRPQA
jgi:hypothetical protein